MPMADLDALARRWRDQLAAWAIPDSITAAAEESPWALPHGAFERRTRSLVEDPSGVSFERAREALAPAGEVLDVGAGTGAAGLPLAPWARAITAVDEDATMLAVLAGLARELDTPVRTIEGRWPDVAGHTGPADVVVCHHVLFNVADLVPFVRALTDHSRRRVVVELPARHPMAPLNPLWSRFHGLDRPTGPIAADAAALLRELGLEPHVQEWRRPAQTLYASEYELVETTRRRLCLPPARHGEVAAALRDLGDDGPFTRAATRELVTVWWTGTAARGQ